MSNKEAKFNKKQFKILQMKDSSDKAVIKKKLIFDVPIRLGIVGNSGSGKTNFLASIILDPLNQFYKDVWDAENIFVFSGSLKTDNKIQGIIKALDVPDSNTFDEYDDDIVNLLYEEIEDRVATTTAKKGKQEHSLFIFDDLSYSNSIRNKRNNALGRLFLNGRKNHISTIFVAQRYNQILPAVRINLTGLVIFNMPTSELEMVERDHNFKENRKSFYKMVRNNLKERHDFLIINYSNNFAEMYLDKSFKSLDE